MRHTQDALRPPPSAAPTLDDARWVAVLARDGAFDGHFYYSVETTGIYCRPSCAARRPERRFHIRFHHSAEDAEAAGFRACKRCKPNAPSPVEAHTKMVADACRLIEAAEEAPKLEKLARQVGLSPYHFHRVFKSVLGVTPKAYAIAHRNKRVRAALAKPQSVTEAIYDAGFNSNGRFYATSSETLGMTPEPVPLRRRQRRNQVRNQPKLARIATRCGERQGRVRHFVRQRPRRSCERPQEVVSECAARRRRSLLRAVHLDSRRFCRRSNDPVRPSFGHSRNGVSAPGVERSPANTRGLNGELRGHRQGHRRTQIEPRGGACLRV